MSTLKLVHFQTAECARSAYERKIQRAAQRLWKAESRGHALVHGCPGDPVKLAFEAWKNEIDKLCYELGMPHGQNPGD